MNKAQKTERAAMLEVLNAAMHAHRADRTSDAKLVEYKRLEKAFGEWEIDNNPKTGLPPVFGPAWVKRRVSEQRSDCADRIRRDMAAKAKAGVL